MDHYKIKILPFDKTLSLNFLDGRYVNVTGDTMTGPLTLKDIIFNGATGANTIDLPDNLADALSITSGGEDRIVITTANDAEQVRILGNGRAATPNLFIEDTSGTYFWAGDSGTNIGVSISTAEAGTNRPIILEILGGAFTSNPQLSLFFDDDDFLLAFDGGAGGSDRWQMVTSVNDLEINPGGGNLLLGGNLDMQENKISNFDQIAMKSAVEATISSGAITITEGHIRVDTEADATNDDLDTINSTQSGEILFLLPANDARTVRIRHGIGNIFLKHQVESKSFSFSSPAGSSGTFYSGGYYNWTSTNAGLNETSPTSVTHSAANSPSACHIGIVAGGAGVVDTGVVKLTVTGTTIDDDGNRLTSQTVDLVADITTLSLNDYVETSEKFIGQVTIQFATVSGSPVNFNLDFNYGCSKYEDFGNQAFTVNVLECVGLAGANDTGFNLRLFHHSGTGWTYAATGFVPGGTVLANMNTDYSTEQNLANGESFAYKRANLNQDIAGDNGEGLVLEITTGANKAVEIMDIHFGVHTAPNFAYLATTKQHLIFMKHGDNWLEL